MTEEFIHIVKGLSADKNTEKEKEMKMKCDSWISEQLKTPAGLTNIENFFQYISKESDPLSQSHTPAHGALNAFGIFAHSIKSNEELKEKYIPVILDILIQNYCRSDMIGKPVAFTHPGQKGH